MASRPCLDLEIGLSVAARADLLHLGVSDPDQWTFVPYSIQQVAGDGRSKGFGFPTASWTWEFLSQDQLDVFLDLFTAASDASVVVHIQTYQDTGMGIGNMAATYQAIMTRPVDGQGKTLVRRSTFPVYSDVTVSFTHLESE